MHVAQIEYIFLMIKKENASSSSLSFVFAISAYWMCQRVSENTAAIREEDFVVVLFTMILITCMCVCTL